jgi:flagellin
VTLTLRGPSPSHRALNTHSDQYARAVGRVSSGLRIVRAADDAAGLAISEKLRARVTGSAMATRNVHDAINLLGTAEGGLQGITDLLQRARALSVQAASTGSTTSSDREAAAAEVRQLVAEVDRIAGTTAYNGLRLLDGSRSGGFTFLVGADGGEVLSTDTGDVRATTLGLLELAGVSTFSTTTTYVARSAPLTTYTSSQGRREFTFSVGGGPTQSFKIDKGVVFTSAKYGELRDRIQAGLAAATPPIPVTVSLATASDGTTRLDFAVTGSPTTSLTVTGSGATALGGITTESSSTTLGTFGVAGPSVADLVAAGSEDAMDRLDAALTAVLSSRTGLGATQNRLEHRLGVLAATEQNLGAARSRIVDADMAVEYAALVRAKILGDAGLALQAQQAPSGRRVLQLLDSL